MFLPVRHIVFLCTITIALYVTASPSLATPDYAKQTGYDCGKCHVDVIGGGKLTDDR